MENALRTNEEEEEQAQERINWLEETSCRRKEGK
jgi:hypothetical protein